MKHLRALSALIIMFTCRTFGQTPIWSVEAAKYAGKTVSFDEYVYDVSYDADNRTFIIRLADPDVKQSPTIKVLFRNIKNKKRISWLQSLNGQTISVTGKLLNVRGKFTINGNDPATKLVAEKDYRMTDPRPVAPPPIGTNIAITDAAAHVGELVNLCDTVHVYPVVADSLTLFCLGGRYPHQLLTVAVKDRSAVFKVDHYIGDPMCVTGTIVLRNNKPVLLIKNEAAMLTLGPPR
jgi:hypothetical protein